VRDETSIRALVCQTALGQTLSSNPGDVNDYVFSLFSSMPLVIVESRYVS